MRQKFDFDWKFKNGDVEDGEKPDLNDREWQKVDLPHDWSISGPIAEDNPPGKSCGYYPAGIGWYR